MSIIAWIVLGLLAGLIAKAIMPGAERIGLILTTILGVVGAILGGRNPLARIPVAPRSLKPFASRTGRRC